MEFTKEENNAIERINNLIWGFRRNKQSKFKKDLWGYFKYRDYEATDILLNLIEKQQKEINKAIEYIENDKKELYGCGNYYLSDLLNILKGEINVK